MATLKIKMDPIFLLGMFKNLKICNLIFRVPKICTSGLPYLAWTQLPRSNFIAIYFTN